MNRVEVHRTDELRRQIVERRRERVTLNAEFNRLQTQRSVAPADVRDGLLREIDLVAGLHRAATNAMDALTDELIRLQRVHPPRWRRVWRHAA